MIGLINGAIAGVFIYSFVFLFKWINLKFRIWKAKKFKAKKLNERQQFNQSVSAKKVRNKR